MTAVEITETTEATIKQVLVNALGNGLGVHEIDPDVDLIDGYGIDSLQMISFLLGVEDAFDIELDYAGLNLDDLRSVRQYAAYVERLTQAQVS